MHPLKHLSNPVLSKLFSVLNLITVLQPSCSFCLLKMIPHTLYCIFLLIFAFSLFEVSGSVEWCFHMFSSCLSWSRKRKINAGCAPLSILFPSFHKAASSGINSANGTSNQRSHLYLPFSQPSHPFNSVDRTHPVSSRPLWHLALHWHFAFCKD